MRKTVVNPRRFSRRKAFQKRRKALINKEKPAISMDCWFSLFWCSAGISPDGDKLRLPGSDRKKNPPPKGERFFLVLQRGFPLTGIDFDSPGATRKNLPAKRRGDFLVLQRGFPLTGINFDSPGAAEKRIPRRKARDSFWCSSGDSNPGHPA